MKKSYLKGLLLQGKSPEEILPLLSETDRAIYEMLKQGKIYKEIENTLNVFPAQIAFIKKHLIAKKPDTINTAEPEIIVQPDAIDSIKPVPVIQPDTINTNEPKITVQPDAIDSIKPVTVIQPDTINTNEPKITVQPDAIDSTKPVTVMQPDTINTTEPKTIVKLDTIDSIKPVTVIQPDTINTNEPKTIVKLDTIDSIKPVTVIQPDTINTTEPKVIVQPERRISLRDRMSERREIGSQKREKIKLEKAEEKRKKDLIERQQKNDYSNWSVDEIKSELEKYKSRTGLRKRRLYLNEDVPQNLLQSANNKGIHYIIR